MDEEHTARTPEVVSEEEHTAPRHLPVEHRPGPDALSVFTIEDVGLARAQKLANQLGGLIREKHLAVSIGGNRREHIRVEGWCAIGALVGITPKTERLDEIRNPNTGELEGYQATCVGVRLETGQVVGRATAGCFFDEQEYSSKRGDWYDRWLVNGRGNRHAVMSMAQTRATSKCLGQILRFIPVMAGFSGTPYEEMAGIGGDDFDGYVDRAREDRGRGRSQPQRPKSNGAQRNGAPSDGSAKISDAQAKRLWAKAHDRARSLGDDSLPATEIVRAVFRHHGFERTEEVTRAVYDRICDEIEIFDPGPPPEEDVDQTPPSETADPPEGTTD